MKYNDNDVEFAYHAQIVLRFLVILCEVETIDKMMHNMKSFLQDMIPHNFVEYIV